MKQILFLAVPALSLIALSACTAAADTSLSDDDSASSIMMDFDDDDMNASSSFDADDADGDEDDVSIPSSVSAQSSAATSATATSGDTSPARIINMNVTDWQFSPNSITVKKGEKVVIRLTDSEGVHSFASNDLGLNVRINPGQTKDIVIDTSNAGTFNFRCGVPCGPGHEDMKGQIIIQ